jgi:6-phosphogluconolactonase
MILVNLPYLRAWAAALLIAGAAHAADDLVYAGTYTSGSSRGIYGYRFDPRGAKLKPLGLSASIPNPTFLVAHPDNRFLYAVSQEAGGSVNAFLISPKTGKLSLRATSRSTAAAAGSRWPITAAAAWPCYRYARTAEWEMR